MSRLSGAAQSTLGQALTLLHPPWWRAGVALGTYGTVGVFGASIFGDATASNIMTNDLLDAPGPTLALYAALLLYLCCGELAWPGGACCEEGECALLSWHACMRGPAHVCRDRADRAARGAGAEALRGSAACSGAWRACSEGPVAGAARAARMSMQASSYHPTTPRMHEGCMLMHVHMHVQQSPANPSTKNVPGKSGCSSTRIAGACMA